MLEVWEVGCSVMSWLLSRKIWNPSVSINSLLGTWVFLSKSLQYSFPLPSFVTNGKKWWVEDGRPGKSQEVKRGVTVRCVHSVVLHTDDKVVHPSYDLRSYCVTEFQGKVIFIYSLTRNRSRTKIRHLIKSKTTCK